jgi:His-Xaa-Ser system protein HxsD
VVSRRFLAEAFAVEDVERTLYKYAASLVGSISRVTIENVEYISVDLTSRVDHQDLSVEMIAGFEVDVQDQALRRKIKAETESSRNLILAHTFSHLTAGSSGR